jgi:urea carboxylase
VFTRVLVANRGEVAVRIIRTLRRMGIGAVAACTEIDRSTLPARLADELVVVDSYLDVDAVVAAAVRAGCDAVHPGYGFLAERASAAEAFAAAGVTFVGPSPTHLREFGLKHRARELAAAAGVPLLPASGLLVDAAAAVEAAADVGYPVVVKATAGGGGIGMRVCADAASLEAAFASAAELALSAFGDAGVYVERYLAAARHVEVQIVGDGRGRVIALGDRDCSVQRRNQKVIEEAPAPRLPSALRDQLHAAAVALGESVSYASVGTVEFLVDVAGGAAAFLEVNTRLQVEHAVTEAIYDVDLVEWMLRIAAGDASMLTHEHTPRGHAIEARVYAENPWRDHQPSAGLLTEVSFPGDVRVDTWVERGTEVTPHYDPLLAKVVAVGRDRGDAVDQLAAALGGTTLEGVTTNVALLRAVLGDEAFRAGDVSTAMLAKIAPTGRVIEVVSGGALTMVQEYPGRIGLWPVGVPPSGPIDDRSFRDGNAIVGNDEGTAGLELTALGPTLAFHAATRIALTGAPTEAQLSDGTPLPMWTPVDMAAGEVITIGRVGPPGLRAYLLVAGGIASTPTLGSRATFTLGRFGGHGGRALRPGDMLHLNESHGSRSSGDSPRPRRGESPGERLDGGLWEVGVVEGPHAEPEFFTAADMEAFYAATWQVHHNSDRTGIRLIGPSPGWARADGGEAGLHPSNIHDTAYAVGAVDFTGDMPIILGPDGPSLGGFVCPAVVESSQRWKLGQLRAGDDVRFVARAPRTGAGGVLDRREPDGDAPAVCWRQAGDDYVLVEYGPMVLDLALRFRVHALEQWLAARHIAGILEVTAGVRSLQVHVDPKVLPTSALLPILQAAENELSGVADAAVESRVVHLPLSWDDPATREAISRYMTTVRDDAPWCPWNIEFIRRINGLADVADVHRTVFDASYLVLGLGDVYLGAPVATPLDPRHRLVTTKYNPARTWTPENAVGIGGAYLCIYGMEGPGGYQFVGRTVQVWNRFHRTAEFGEPWLLRNFDRISFFEVSADELSEWRRDLPVGAASLDIQPGVLRLADQLAFEADNARAIDAFRAQQQGAFAEERARWAAAGEFDRVAALNAVAPSDDGAAAGAYDVPAGLTVVESPLAGSVWKVVVDAGTPVAAGDTVVVLEAMKMETAVPAAVAGRVTEVLVRPGDAVTAGQALVALDSR